MGSGFLRCVDERTLRFCSVQKNKGEKENHCHCVPNTLHYLKKKEEK